MDAEEQMLISGRAHPTSPVACQLCRIYTESFPPEERESFDCILDGVAAGRHELFVAKVGQAAVGFAVTQVIPGVEPDLLAYLAVARDRRGQGIGSRLLQHARTALAAGAGPPGLLIEVESVQRAPAAERLQRARRIEFYRKNGARVIEEVADYMIPSVTDGRRLQMALLWLPVRPDATAPTGPALRECVFSIYTRVYGLSAEDPIVVSVCSAL